MSLREFWTNVRTGARLLAPGATADSPKLDVSAIERALRAATFWLTPRGVVGFDEADFDFLPGSDQLRLAALVKEFRQIAAQVPPTAPASDEQIAQALPLFRDIVAMLEFDRYGDADAFRLGKQIERRLATYRPAELAELRFTTGLDHTSDPGLWIWGFLTDNEEEAFLARTRTIRRLLDGVAREVAPDRFPYINFRSVADQAELLQLLETGEL